MLRASLRQLEEQEERSRRDPTFSQEGETGQRPFPPSHYHEDYRQEQTMERAANQPSHHHRKPHSPQRNFSGRRSLVSVRETTRDRARPYNAIVTLPQAINDPLSPDIMATPFPPGWSRPKMKLYEGDSDPTEHINFFIGEMQ